MARNSELDIFRMNAQQIYLCMYFTVCTALICILNIVKVGHDIGGNIIRNKHDAQKTALQQET